jgi:hypothetical protein
VSHELLLQALFLKSVLRPRKKKLKAAEEATKTGMGLLGLERKKHAFQTEVQ